VSAQFFGRARIGRSLAGLLQPAWRSVAGTSRRAALGQHAEGTRTCRTRRRRSCRSCRRWTSAVEPEVALGERCASHSLRSPTPIGTSAARASTCALTKRARPTLRISWRDLKSAIMTCANRDILPSTPRIRQFNNRTSTSTARIAARRHRRNVMRSMMPASRTTSNRAAADHTRHYCTTRTTWLGRCAGGSGMAAPSSSKATSPMCRRSPGRASVSCC